MITTIKITLKNRQRIYIPIDKICSIEDDETQYTYQEPTYRTIIHTVDGKGYVTNQSAEEIINLINESYHNDISETLFHVVEVNDV